MVEAEDQGPSRAAARLLEAYDRQLRIGLVPFEGELTILPHLVRHTLPPPRRSFIRHSSLAGMDVDRVVAGEVERFRAHGGPLEWPVFSHDRPAGLRERLEAHGFRVEEAETIMALEIARAPHALLQATAPGIREIGAGELGLVEGLLEQVWGRDFGWLRRRFEDELSRPGYLRVFLAEVDGEPAATAWVYLYPGSEFAGLYGGSTLPAHRGRGLYGALLATRLRAALERGYRYLTVDAGPMSAPILERRGFLRLATAWPCVWEPS